MTRSLSQFPFFSQTPSAWIILPLCFSLSRTTQISDSCNIIRTSLNYHFTVQKPNLLISEYAARAGDVASDVFNKRFSFLAAWPSVTMTTIRCHPHGPSVLLSTVQKERQSGRGQTHSESSKDSFFSTDTTSLFETLAKTNGSIFNLPVRNVFINKATLCGRQIVPMRPPLLPH